MYKFFELKEDGILILNLGNGPAGMVLTTDIELLLVDPNGDIRIPLNAPNSVVGETVVRRDMYICENAQMHVFSGDWLLKLPYMADMDHYTAVKVLHDTANMVWSVVASIIAFGHTDGLDEYSLVNITKHVRQAYKLEVYERLNKLYMKK